MHGLMRTRLRQLRTDELGAVISAELVVVGTVLTIGLATGWAALQKSVVTELSDFSEAISSLDQSYSFSGRVLVGCGGCCLASSASSCYTDVDLAGYTAKAFSESNCCLSPIIVRDPAKPGHWHCDRCGHYHQPGTAQRSGQSTPAHPPRSQTDRAPSGRSADTSPNAGRGGNSSPESDRPPVRRKSSDAPPSSRENSAPFTPRSGSGKPQPKPTEEPRSRKPRTSETNSEPNDSDTENALFMLAQLPADHPQYRPLPVPDPDGPQTPVPDVPSHGTEIHSFPPQPPHGHEHSAPPVPRHGFPLNPAAAHEFATPGAPDHNFHGHHHPIPHHPPRYEYRGTREPISSAYRGGFGYQHHAFHHDAPCSHCQGLGTIRPGFEFYSGVRRVRVMEIPLAPYAGGFYADPSGASPPVMPFNHHHPRFPEYVW